NYSAAIVRIFLFEQLIKLVELPWVQMRQMWVIAVLRALRIPHRNMTAGFVVLDRVHEAATRLPLQQSVSVVPPDRGAVPLLAPAIWSDRNALSVKPIGDCSIIRSVQ